MVNDIFSGSINPLLIDNISKRTETFYINSIADGGASLLEGPYTIKIDCDQSIVIKHGDAFQTKYTFKLDKTRLIESINFRKFSAWYPDEPSRNIEPYCPIISNAPISLTGVVSTPSCA